VISDAAFTHSNIIALQATFVYSLGIKYLLNHPNDKGRGQTAFKYAQDLSNDLVEITDQYGEQSIQAWLRLAEKMASDFKEDGNHPMPRLLNPLKGIGWTKHAFVLSFYWLLILDEEDQKCYHKAVRRTIQCGGDTDTNAAIVGGMVGALVGISAIPEEMK
jgi:ADP-ribosyl-[dinitrogen reductase] hydrolase